MCLSPNCFPTLLPPYSLLRILFLLSLSLEPFLVFSTSSSSPNQTAHSPPRHHRLLHHLSCHLLSLCISLLVSFFFIFICIRNNSLSTLGFPKHNHLSPSLKCIDFRTFLSNIDVQDYFFAKEGFDLFCSKEFENFR